MEQLKFGAERLMLCLGWFLIHNFEYLKLQNIKRHLRIHISDEPFKVTICSYKSGRLENLLSRIKIRNYFTPFFQVSFHVDIAMKNLFPLTSKVWSCMEKHVN